MANRPLAVLLIVCAMLACSAVWIVAQDERPDDTVIRRVVDMVQLNVAVTDRDGKYVTGLNPADFVIMEDGKSQKLATFEGALGLRPTAETSLRTDDPAVVTTPASSLGPSAAAGASASSLTTTPVTGAKVFVLFDTSNYMYRSGGFVFAQDAIADFIRSMDGPERVAFYSYSRDFTRAAPLTPDRSEVLRAVRSTVNGSDSALYNALLITLRDASQFTGKRAIVVFSNGPDNASMVPPENVAELAQSIGVPIYMISTREARLDPVSTAVFERMSINTGGRAFFARNWTEESKAFEAVRNDLENLYVLSYYPLPNPNRGWREISVRLTGTKFRNLTVRTRSGYRPLPVQLNIAAAPAG
jgi:Ca-activated chloride channel family protein